MKFGLSFLPDSDGQHLSATTYFENALKLAKQADQAHLHTIKITEHYLHPYGGFCPDPVSFLSAVAACTRNIRLMTGCILPVFEHPVKIAAKTAMLDAISHGRLDVGFARAYLPHEFSTFEVEMNGSRQLYEQTIEAVIRLWTEKDVNVQSAHFNLRNVCSFPEPVQRPHPPVWGAAVMSRQSFSWLGEKGFNLLLTPPLNGIQNLNDKTAIYLEAFNAAHPHKTPQITLSMPLLIAEDETVAKREADLYLANYIQVWADATESWLTHASSDYPGYSGLGSILRANTPEKMRGNLQALVGTPAMIAERIQKLSDNFHLDQIIWQIDFGSQPYAISERTLQLFIQEVLPQLQKINQKGIAHANSY